MNIHESILGSIYSECSEFLLWREIIELCCLSNVSKKWKKVVAKLLKQKPFFSVNVQDETIYLNLWFLLLCIFVSVFPNVHQLCFVDTDGISYLNRELYSQMLFEHLQSDMLLFINWIFNGYSVHLHVFQRPLCLIRAREWPHNYRLVMSWGDTESVCLNLDFKMVSCVVSR